MVEDHYRKIANLLITWLSEYPEKLETNNLLYRVKKYNNEEEITADFVSNEAQFHKTCKTKYDQQKLDRERLKRKKEEHSSDTVSKVMH